MSDENPEYKIGNCNPPLDTRWKPGQSGNPSGRKRGSRSLRAVFLRAANAKPQNHPSLKPYTEPTQLDQVFARLFESAMHGHKSAVRELLVLSRALMTEDDDDDESAAADAAEEAAAAPCKPDGNG